MMCLEHYRKRAGHQSGPGARLDDAGDDQHVQRRSERAQSRGERERGESEREDPPATEQVRQLTATYQEGREYDVVGVQYPRDVREVRVREVLGDVRQRDVDAAGV